MAGPLFSNKEPINVFVVGSKGIPAQYGGFETFVENLTKRKKSSRIHYFVSCMEKEERTFEHNSTLCFSVGGKTDKASQRILNVSKSLAWVESYLKENPNPHNIVYILGCRIGPLLKQHVKKLHKLGCAIWSNPDGLEWKRGKWSAIEKKILKYCEKCLVLNSDYLICDSRGIQDYILNEYKRVRSEDTRFIAYGCDLQRSQSSQRELSDWLDGKGVSKEGYYLVVGRFVPENNYEVIIREFMKTKTKKDLVIVTNVEKNKFFTTLEDDLHFSKDPRIKFVGTLYEQELLKKVRENAYAYIHGHSVGGTNPSLLEALGATGLNLLFDVPFNEEVGENQCLYFNASEGSLAALIEQVELKKPVFNPSGIIERRYSWDSIVQSYEKEILTYFERNHL